MPNQSNLSLSGLPVNLQRAQALHAAWPQWKQQVCLTKACATTQAAQSSLANQTQGVVDGN